MDGNSKDKPEFTGTMKCGHCANFAPMKKVASYSTVKPQQVYDEDSGEIAYEFNEGYFFDTLKCSSCGDISFAKIHYDDSHYEDDDYSSFGPYQVLYPLDDKLPIGLPVPLQKAYEAAVKVRPIDANAYGVLVGRLLEMVCEDRKAQGKDLHSKLGDLAAKGEIPNNLVGVADGLRHFRNVGAHAGLGELTKQEIPILSSLTKAILEYVYSAPHLARMAQEMLNKLHNR